jgi:7-carboxy-7-deazaguanine synthase
MKNKKSGQDPEPTLKVNEIFFSIQGESTHIGRPCVFVRLTYCNLRCIYCDTTYAFYEGKDETLTEIISEISKYECRLIEITGGEPLIQKNVLPLMRDLCDLDYEVLLETAGHMDISRVDKRVKIIMDIKCPSSGESGKVLWSNIPHLKDKDEVKFVLGSEQDLEWAGNVIKTYGLIEICPVIFSPVFRTMNNRTLAEWILASRLPVRMQIQLHKHIWDPEARGR